MNTQGRHNRAVEANRDSISRWWNKSVREQIKEKRVEKPKNSDRAKRDSFWDGLTKQ